MILLFVCFVKYSSDINLIYSSSIILFYYLTYFLVTKKVSKFPLFVPKVTMTFSVSLLYSNHAKIVKGCLVNTNPGVDLDKTHCYIFNKMTHSPLLQNPTQAYPVKTFTCVSKGQVTNADAGVFCAQLVGVNVTFTRKHLHIPQCHIFISFLKSC